MRTAFVIHAGEDRGFLESRLLKLLPSRGFGDCVSSADVAASAEDFASVMTACEVILVVVSKAATQVPLVRQQAQSAVASRRPLIPILADDTKPDRVEPGLGPLPAVDLSAKETDNGLKEAVALADALPPPAAESPGSPARVALCARRLGWNEEVFSGSLAHFVDRHDHSRASFLVANFEEHARARPYPYAPEPARRDLSALRRDRQFALMVQYAEAALASGTKDAQVRRQYGQALIELRSYGRALDVLQAIVKDPKADAREVDEAKGLIGRVYKQRYVDAPKALGSRELIRRAIAAYQEVYDRDALAFWHGINAASCIVRAHRDGVRGASPKKARQIASRILGKLRDVEKQLAKENKRLPVWDCATRIEALLILGRFRAADAALDPYLGHPDMRAFEVSSTYRQFVELLQIDREPRCRMLFERLGRAVHQYRTGGLLLAPRRSASAGDAPGGKKSVTAKGAPAPAPERIAILIRVSDPAWQPEKIPGLQITARMGTIVSATCDAAGLSALPHDTRVSSIEESRPGGRPECVKSMPFVRATDAHQKYSEEGTQALIAVVDYGIDVLHKAFLDADGKSRVVGIWDQRDPTGPPPADFTFGTHHSAAQIAGYVRKQEVAKLLKRDQDGHGTHVASIAAGRAVADFAGGVAPDAKLLVVISASDQQPIGYSKSHVEALHFVAKVADKLKLPVVVNVSQGMNAGAHDGRSALEVAFDTFTEGGRRPGRVVVKSAGNERNKAGHAKVTLGAQAREQLRWARDPGAQKPERIELWWSAADEISFRLKDPLGNQSPVIGGGDLIQEGQLGSDPYVLQLTRWHPDNGDSQLLIRIGGSKQSIQAGEWALELTSGLVPRGGEVHAWIERSLDPPTNFLNHPSEEMTLSIPGTCQNVIAVAAVGSEEPISVGDFSSYGPTRDGREKPDLAAPGVGIVAARSGSEDLTKPDSGTSMSAPHVTGAIALLFSRRSKAGLPCPTATQVTAALRQKTRYYNGRWDRGRGYGVLDVQGLLDAF